MSFTDFTCFAGELCLYMSTLGFVVSRFGETRGSLLYIALGLIAGTGCMLAQRAKGALRFLPLLLFAPAFLLARSVAAVILPVPVLLLMVLRSHARAWRGEYELTRTLFKAGTCVYMALLAVMALAGSGSRFLTDALPLFVTWLLLTVLNLRLLRNGDTANFGGRFRVLNALLVLGVALIGFLLSSDLAVTAFMAVVRAVYGYVVGPLLFAALCVVATLPAVIAYLFMLFLRLFQADREPPELDLSGVPGLLEDYDGTVRETSVWFQRAAVAVVVLLFLLLAFFIARKLVSGREAPPQTARPLVREHVSVRTNRRRTFGNSPAERVRAAYRKYLMLCAGLDIPVDGSVASDVIRDSSSPYTGAEDAGNLRDTWLRARFSGRGVTDADAREARRLVRRMRSSAEKAKRAENNADFPDRLSRDRETH